MRYPADEVLNFRKEEPTNLWALDPLDNQSGGSLTVPRVAMVRVARVAAETGARMQRDGLSADPMDWMLTPLALFDGRPPIEACLEREGCSQAILLHGLGLDLNPGPRVFARLTAMAQEGANHD